MQTAIVRLRSGNTKYRAYSICSDWMAHEIAASKFALSRSLARHRRFHKRRRLAQHIRGRTVRNTVFR